MDEADEGSVRFDLAAALADDGALVNPADVPDYPGMVTARLTPLLLTLAALWPLASCSDTTAGAADAIVVDPTPEPDVVDPSPEPDIVDPSPEPDIVDPSPEPDIVDPSPEPDVVDPTPEPDVAPMSDVTAPSDASPEDVGDPPDAGPPPELFDPATVQEVVDAFPMGVQAADATPDGALLWTQLTYPAEGVRVVVFGADDVILADLPATPADGGFTEVEVAGLEPWTDYRYAFIADEPVGASEPVRSEIGRFRTAPAPDAQPALVFGATSCNDAGFMSPTPLNHAATAELDLFLMAGDTVYADDSDAVADYRAVWEYAYLDPPMRAVHRSTSFLYTWDDHEIDNNWDPETFSPATIAAGTQAFFEHAPMRRPAEDPTRIWRSYRWGLTAEFFVVDARGERKPSTMDTDAAQYLSPDQMAWLRAGLLASEATFKIILHGVAFTDMPWQYPAAGDRWEGYDAQRAQLIDTLEEVDGVLFISGDFHFGSVQTIEPPGNLLDYIPEVLVGPAAQFGNPGMLLLSFNDQFPYLTLTNNYTRFTADPMADPPEVTVEFVAGDGDVFHTHSLYF